MKTSLIHLKGIKEPIEVTYEQAKKVTEIFFDDKISKDFVINIDDNSFRKSEIRYVRKNNITNRNKPHWIIYNSKRPSIWKQPYLSREEAQIEFDLQVSGLAKGQTHGFVIEERGEKESNSHYLNISDNDFKDFEIPKEIIKGAERDIAYEKEKQDEVLQDALKNLE